jgi:tRNA modification GTPase
VANKVDLGVERMTEHRGDGDVCVSALTGEGVDHLTERLVEILGVGDAMAVGVFSARSRHLLALQDTADAIAGARNGIDAGIGAELVAEQLRYGQEALGSICGDVSTDQLLGEIFASFCVGK